MPDLFSNTYKDNNLLNYVQYKFFENPMTIKISLSYLIVFYKQILITLRFSLECAVSVVLNKQLQPHRYPSSVSAA